MITSVQFTQHKIMESILNYSQTKTFTKEISIPELGKAIISVDVRYDDECRNGYNTFSITATIKNIKGREIASVSIHHYIAKYFPELSHLIKWHMCSSDGPVHYIANTIYHATEHGPTHAWVYENERTVAGLTVKPTLLGYFPTDTAQRMVTEYPNIYMKPNGDTIKIANLESARNCALAPDATLEQLRDKQWLEQRLPALLAEFKSDIESLGFVY